MGSNLRIMDDAFEYLLPTEAKKKKGQFFTPHHVVEMCVRMLNPKRDEYVMDPACGSGGFLLHAMDWCYPANDNDQRELRKHRYASKYLWGIDFEQRAAKTSRTLMLIAGDNKQPKEERDVLFIERILKMLKPGGRAAIILPQGKFNNSSLAFFREWILKKARLLAVVGLHHARRRRRPDRISGRTPTAAERESKQLLEQAKSLVEQLIEEAPRI